MPRAVNGIGRTGRKHKKKAVGGPEAQPKISEGLGAPPSTPVPQETATAVDQVAAQAGPAQAQRPAWKRVWSNAFAVFAILIHLSRAHIHAMRTLRGTASRRSGIEARIAAPMETRSGTPTCRRA